MILEMLRKLLTQCAVKQAWSLMSTRRSSSAPADISTAVNSFLLRSLKEHYDEVTRMNPPPKVNPPSGFSIVKGALDANGPVLTRTHGDEEITISIMRLNDFIAGEGEDDDAINQLLLHVDVSKPGQEKSLMFLCALYPDALGIHSVSLRSKADTVGFHENQTSSAYTGPPLDDLSERIRDSFHGYINERGVDENLFNFLQAWLYVKEHRGLLRWFKTVATFVNNDKSAAKDA